MSKTYKILIDPKAKQDLSELFRYVSFNDSKEAAVNLLESIENTLYKLEQYPERGHIPPELQTTGIKDYLEIHYKPYRIIYEIEKKNIYIHAIIDGRRNIQEILGERLLR